MGTRGSASYFRFLLVGEMNDAFDTEGLKARVNLVDLAGRYSKLAKCTAQEWAGPCPLPNCSASENGFHVHADGWWKCYTCHPKPSDVIEFAQRLRGLDFRAACEWLGADVTQNAPVAPRQPAPKDKPARWKSAEWQAEARRELAEAQTRLSAPDGEPGRAYLAGRGLQPETWQAWGLGYGMARRWDEKSRQRVDLGMSILIPWQRAQITAIKYRVLDNPAWRYISKGGGECLAFGLQMASGHGQTLWLCEGELNALSIWQALRGAHFVNWDVLSFGAEGGADAPLIVKQASRYEQVVIWCDKPDVAADAMRAIEGAHGMRSPMRGELKLDASELLKAGILGDFLGETWRRLDEADASKVLARLEALELAEVA
jgi:hypothetical protein